MITGIVITVNGGTLVGDNTIVLLNTKRLVSDKENKMSYFRFVKP